MTSSDGIRKVRSLLACFKFSHNTTPQIKETKACWSLALLNLQEYERRRKRKETVTLSCFPKKLCTYSGLSGST
jgi:hypothetical protein